jgi:hypothetical protein
MDNPKNWYREAVDIRQAAEKILTSALIAESPESGFLDALVALYRSTM